MATEKKIQQIIDDEVTLIVVLHPKKRTPKSFKGTRAQYIDRVTKIAMRDIKSNLLVRADVFVQS